MFMSLRSKRTFFTAWPLFANSLMQHLSPKTLRQFCFAEVKSLITKPLMGQKDKEWDGRTWVKRPRVVLGARWALFSLASLDLCSVRDGQELQSSQDTRPREKYEECLLGRLDRGETHKVCHCAGHTSHLHLSETGENSVSTSAGPSHSEQQSRAAASGLWRCYISRVWDPLHENCLWNELEPQCSGPHWGPWPLPWGPQKTWLCEAVWPSAPATSAATSSFIKARRVTCLSQHCGCLAQHLAHSMGLMKGQLNRIPEITWPQQIDRMWKIKMLQ